MALRVGGGVVPHTFPGDVRGPAPVCAARVGAEGSDWPSINSVVGGYCLEFTFPWGFACHVFNAPEGSRSIGRRWRLRFPGSGWV